MVLVPTVDCTKFFTFLFALIIVDFFRGSVDFFRGSVDFFRGSQGFFSGGAKS